MYQQYLGISMDSNYLDLCLFSCDCRQKLLSCNSHLSHSLNGELMIHSTDHPHTGIFTHPRWI